jgi:hypothetical protein
MIHHFFFLLLIFLHYNLILLIIITVFLIMNINSIRVVILGISWNCNFRQHGRLVPLNE